MSDAASTSTARLPPRSRSDGASSEFVRQVLLELLEGNRIPEHRPRDQLAALHRSRVVPASDPADEARQLLHVLRPRLTPLLVLAERCHDVVGPADVAR